MTEFFVVSPNMAYQLPAQAIDWLKEACESAGGYVSFGTMIARWQQGHGHIYLAYRHSELMGVFFVDFTLYDCGKVLEVLLMGGNNAPEWIQDADDYFTNLANQFECKQIAINGRPGWGRLLKNFKLQTACHFRNLP